MAGNFNLLHINWENLFAGHAETASAGVFHVLDVMLSHNLRQIVKNYMRVTLTLQSLLNFVFVSGKVNDCGIYQLKMAYVTTEKLLRM